MTLPSLKITRGEIWEVRFDPSEGDEIRKIRPAVVVTAPEAGRMQLQIVVPVTSWQPYFSGYFWMVRLTPTPANGLTKESSADAFQAKSVSIRRFQKKLGMVTNDKLQEIVTAIALCIGYTSDSSF
jgi:mRNA interferase MazF